MAATDDQVDVHLDGFDSDPTRTLHDVRKVFGLDPTAAERFIRSTPCVVKRAVSREEGRRYVKALRSIGGRAEILPTKDERISGGAQSLRIPVTSAKPTTEPAEDPSDPMVRWRASEATGRSIPIPSSQLAKNIPKAPHLPADLFNNIGVSGTPEWMNADPQGGTSAPPPI